MMMIWIKSNQIEPKCRNLIYVLPTLTKGGTRSQMMMRFGAKRRTIVFCLSLKCVQGARPRASIQQLVTLPPSHIRGRLRKKLSCKNCSQQATIEGSVREAKTWFVPCYLAPRPNCCCLNLKRRQRCWHIFVPCTQTFFVADDKTMCDCWRDNWRNLRQKARQKREVGCFKTMWKGWFEGQLYIFAQVVHTWDKKREEVDFFLADDKTMWKG